MRDDLSRWEEQEMVEDRRRRVSATIGKHLDKAGVWCVFVPCDSCKGTGKSDPDEELDDINLAWATDDETADLYDCPDCTNGQRILSTHSSRDGAATSANQINRAEASS